MSGINLYKARILTAATNMCSTEPNTTLGRMLAQHKHCASPSECEIIDEHPVHTNYWLSLLRYSYLDHALVPFNVPSLDLAIGNITVARYTRDTTAEQVCITNIGHHYRWRPFSPGLPLWKFPYYKIRLRCPHPELQNKTERGYIPNTRVQLIFYHFKNDPVNFVLTTTGLSSTHQSKTRQPLLGSHNAG